MLFAKLAPNHVPLWGVWIVILISVVLGCLQFASPIAVNAIFSLCAVALDTSYAIPIACLLFFRDHPEVNFKPGPFDLGPTLSKVCCAIAVSWTAFETVILIMPTVYPVSWTNFNYSWVITLAVMGIAGLWYAISARKYYDGPRTNLESSEKQAHLNSQLARGGDSPISEDVDMDKGGK